MLITDYPTHVIQFGVYPLSPSLSFYPHVYSRSVEPDFDYKGGDGK